MRTLLPLALVAGCATAHPTPKAVLGSYLAAEQTGRYAEAHALLTRADQRARPLDVYISEHLSAGPIWLAVARRTRFELGTPVTANDHQRVLVQAVHPDPHALESRLGSAPMDRIETSPDPLAAMQDWVEAEVGTRPLPQVTEALTYAVRQEDGAWRVWLGLDRQDAAIDALARARRAEAAGDEATAIQAWADLRAVPPDPSGVVQALQAERPAPAPAPAP